MDKFANYDLLKLPLIFTLALSKNLFKTKSYNFIFITIFVYNNGSFVLS